MTSTHGPITTSGTVVSYLPLTTAWSAPAGCSSLFLVTAGYLFLNAPEYHNGVVGSPECVPPEVSIWWYQSLNSASPTAILLGGYDFAYPEAYTTVFSYYADSTSTIGCCPSLFHHPCWNNHEYRSMGSGSRQLLTQRNKQQPLQRFQIGQLRRIQTAHTVPQRLQQLKSAPGLDSKEKIGIGVGVSLGAIILVGLLAIWLLMRRKRNRQAIPPRETILETTNTKPELDSAPAPVKELDSANKIYYELGYWPISQPVAELSNDASPPGKLLTEADISEKEERALEEETSGAYEAAEETYRQIVQWRESHQGDHLYRELMQRGKTLPNLRPSWPLLGKSLMLQGKNNEAAAEKLIRQELDLNMRVLGPEHLLTLFSQGNLANVIRRQLKLEEAEEAYRVALEMSDRVFGPVHAYSLQQINNLAVTLSMRGKKDEAREVYRQTLERNMRNINKAGYDHPDTYPRLHNLKGELDEDEDLQIEITTPRDG
ncbi:hypothetical protein ZTR_09089 [Talaromyces verruculosus]|nr:hypothetical protein ZTR_09089 [Talaromyces verruculosus]